MGQAKPFEHHSAQPIALIVEDDASVREIAAVLLEESEMRVIVCDSAEKAVAHLNRHGAETVLLFADVRLAGLMDGVDLAMRVRRMWPHIRVVLTSGFLDRAAPLPADVEYMPKPWLALDLLMQAERASLAAHVKRAS